MATRIIKCTCEHEYQDKRYGKKKRVHNEAKDGNDVAWTCTVCDKKKLSLGR